MRDFLKKIRNRPEAEKMRLSGALVAVSMIVIFSVWVMGINKGLSGLASYRLDVSSLPPYPESRDTDLSGSLAAGMQNIQESIDADRAAWQAAGDGYIGEKGIVKEDGFLKLKLADMRREDGKVVLEYAQYYKELPVIGRRLLLEVSDDKSSVVEKENDLAEDVEVATDPAISSENARKIALKELGTGVMELDEAQLAIAGYDGGFCLVWQLVFFDGESGEQRQVLVGAQRGSIVPAEDPAAAQADNQISNIAE